MGLKHFEIAVWLLSQYLGIYMFSFFHPFSLADGGSVTCELNVGLIAPQSEGGGEEASLVHLREPESGKSSHFVAHCKISNYSSLENLALSPITRHERTHKILRRLAIILT